jgi:glycopeptide antibiotics resistance protein
MLIVLVFLVAEIFYLSWLPEGHLGKETHLPTWLLNWSNTYFNVRTAIPFTILSFLLCAWHSVSTPIPLKIKIPFWVVNIGTASFIVCLAEGGQFFISHRHPDPKDVVYGILGSILGCVLYYLFNNCIVKTGIKNEKQA